MTPNLLREVQSRTWYTWYTILRVKKVYVSVPAAFDEKMQRGTTDGVFVVRRWRRQKNM